MPQFPSRAITSTLCLKVRESILLQVARATKTKGRMWKRGAMALDTGVEFDRPSTSHILKVVMALVLTAHQYRQILWSIVQRVAVDVVRVFVGAKRAVQLLAEYHAMLKFPDIWVRDLYFHVDHSTPAAVCATGTYRTIARMGPTRLGLWHGVSLSREEQKANAFCEW